MATTTAFGQEVLRVRAGEHPTYSRLVVPVPPSTQWSFTSASRSAELFVPIPNSTFAYDQVFDRIPKTRILSLESENADGGAVLRLKFACACEANASVSGRYLVIDIGDPKDPEPSENPVEVAVAEPDTPSDGEPETEPTIAPRPRPTPPADTADVSAPVVGPDDVADRLISQLERAAEQGLVDLQTEPDGDALIEEPVADKLEASEQSVENEAETEATALEPFAEQIDGFEELSNRLARAFEASGETDVGSSIRLTLPEEVPTSPRRPARSERDRDFDAATDHECPDDLLFDLGVFDERRKPVEQIIELRSGIIGEFDAPNSEAAADLARLYIALGFANEADVVINEFLPADERSALLQEMARVVGGKRAITGGLLDKFATCPGAVSLWRTAAFSRDESQPVQTPEAVVDELAGVSLPLRRQLAPRLVESFLARDQLEAARSAFAILDRAPGFHGHEHEFQRAMLRSADGDHIGAEALLLSLFKTEQPISPRAGVKLLYSLVERGVPVPAPLIEDIEAQAMLYRDHEIGVQLRIVEVLAKSKTGRLDDALDVIRKEMTRAPDFRDDYIDAADVILADVGENPLPPGEFAKTIFAHMPLVKADGIADETREVLAEAMLASGLPNAALDLMANDQDSGNGQRDLAAEALLIADRPDQVLEIVPETETGPTALLRAAALTKLGNHGDAYGVARGAESEDVGTYAWRAGDWTAVSDDPNLGPLANYMLHRSGERPLEPYDESTSQEAAAFLSATPDPNEPSIETAELLRKQSAAIREAVSDLIEADSR